MSFDQLTFPLTVDFGSGEYWIGETGPYKYGEAATAFLTGEDLGQTDSGMDSLRQEMEVYLKTFGSVHQPYPQGTQVSEEMFDQLKQSSAECSVNYAFHPERGKIRLLERYTFPALRDFLYVELGKSILKGNSPRKCRLCDGWFLHEHGGRSIYCERIAPGEVEQTCREVGARAVFENKIRAEETWKLYKRAYKKYYARVMKGNMGREEFNAWVEHAAAQRDFTIKLLKVARSKEERAQHLETLREDLNQL